MMFVVGSDAERVSQYSYNTEDKQSNIEPDILCATLKAGNPFFALEGPCNLIGFYPCEVDPLKTLSP